MTDLRKAVEQVVESLDDGYIIKPGMSDHKALRAALEQQEPTMTRDDIIRLMQESCDKDKVDAWHNDFWTITQEELERFAALVAAAERDRMKSEGWRQCAEGQRTTQYCGLLDAAVKAEREACALVAESYEPTCESCPSGVANAIRARGERK